MYQFQVWNVSCETLYISDGFIYVKCEFKEIFGIEWWEINQHCEEIIVSDHCQAFIISFKRIILSALFLL